VITLEEFQAAITSLLQLLPMQRPLTPAALVLAWDTFPASAKRDLTGEVLRFCVGQRLMDPAPPKELAPHLALLRYAYPLENDRPATQRRLRSDLAERMAAPDRFHDPAPVRHEQVPPPERLRLPGGGRPWHPSQLSPEELQARVERVAEEMQRIWAGGMDGRTWEPREMAWGCFSFGKALQGFWPLEAESPASAWILRNPKPAAEMLQQARAGLLQAAPAVEVVPIGAVVGSLRGGKEGAPWR
jgi:hypothetical protein